jgi:hypothetical protein
MIPPFRSHPRPLQRADDVGSHPPPPSYLLRLCGECIHQLLLAEPPVAWTADPTAPPAGAEEEAAAAERHAFLCAFQCEDWQAGEQ